MNNPRFVNRIQVFGLVVTLIVSVGCDRAGCAGRRGVSDASDLGVPTDEGDQGGAYSDDGSSRDVTEEPDRRVAFDRWTPEDKKDCGFPPKYEPCDEDLPEPDTPCDQEGEIRCTNEGASVRYPSFMPYCLRPNYVRCEKGQDGQLEWVIHKVPPIPGDLDYHYRVCQENARGVHFCPGSLVDTVLQFPQELCDPRLHGLPFCSSPYISRCDFADNIDDKLMKEVHIDPVLKKCPTCANCLYRWPFKICPDGPYFCTYEEYRSGRWHQIGRCILDENCQPRCAETREEFCVR